MTEATVETPRRKAGVMATLKKISDKQKKKQKGQRPVRSMARAGGNGGPCWSISKDKETQMHNLIRTSRGLIQIIEREDFTFMSRLFHNNLIHTILTIKIVKISVFHNNLID